MSDVPVGVLLSGGIDSTIVTAVAQRRHGQPLNTFAIGFEQRGAPVDAAYNLDRRYAALAAERIGTVHHEIILDDAFDLEGMLRQLTQALDEPVWELSFVYGPLMTFGAVAIVLVVVMTRTTHR